MEPRATADLEPGARRLPRAHLIVVAGLLGFCALVLLDRGRWLGPGAWAAAIGHVSHTLRLVLLGVWWTFLLLGVARLGFLTAGAVGFASRHAGRLNARARVLAALAMTLLAACFVPAWCVLVALPGLMVVHLVQIRRRPKQPSLVARDRTGVVSYRAPGWYLESLKTFSLTISGVVIVAISGALTAAQAPQHAAVGAFLGSLYGWAALAGAASYVYLQSTLVPRSWPRDQDPEPVEEMRLRYDLFRGLARIFHAVEGRTYPNSDGMLIGVQYWFVPGLLRDVRNADSDDEDLDESVLGIVGPPFDTVLTPESRAHHGRIMDAVALDFVFVQDGVKWDDLERVLHRIYRVYDESNGGRAAEEHDFAGLEHVEVLIRSLGHESASSPGADDNAADDDELGFARVLSVFKDNRPPEEAEPEVPQTSDHRPLVGSGV